ncbi:MAG: hypothetical protein QHH00_04205 [Methanomassiliicoccales archaeon]|jgi:hypothetical protein|nr:hypothetical protein [Methanomassiliicoccales archaeon]
MVDLHASHLKKLILIYAFISNVVILILISMNPMKSYELSLYSEVPLIIWLMLVANIFIGIATVLSEYLRKDENRSYLWIAGMIVIILNILVVQWLPFLRGSYALGGDHMTQIGYTKDIILTGYFYQENYYPITHILISSLSMIASVPIHLIGNYFTAITSTFYVLSIYLIARTIFYERKICTIAAIVAASVLYTGYELYLMPNGWSIHFIPLFIYLFIRSNKDHAVQFSLMAIILSITFVFFHPLSALYLIILVFSFGIIALIISNFSKKQRSTMNELPKRTINFILIILIGFFIWIFAFKQFHHGLEALWLAITAGEGPSFLGKVDAALQKLGWSDWQFLIYIAKVIGHNLILLAISFIGLLGILKLKKEVLAHKIPLFSLYAFSMFAFAIYACATFDLVPGLILIGGDRSLAYTMIFTPVFMGLVYCLINRRKCRKKIIATVFSLVLLIASTLSILALHPSPYSLKPNAEISNSDIITYEWIISKKHTQIGISSILSSPLRYADMICGTIFRDVVVPGKLIIPDHFGYNKSKELGEVLEEDRYIVINKIDRITYSTIWKTANRFSKDDFTKMNFDTSSDRIYTNIEGNVWLTRAV